MCELVLIERDWNMEWALMYWMDTVTQEPHIRFKEYPDCIKDGVTLCKLMNTIDPGCLGGNNDNSGAQIPDSPKARVERFRTAARRYGVPEGAMFESRDLLEKHDIPAVTRCIQALARLAQERGFTGPELDTTLPSAYKNQYYSHMPNIFH